VAAFARLLLPREFTSQLISAAAMLRYFAVAGTRNARAHGRRGSRILDILQRRINIDVSANSRGGRPRQEVIPKRADTIAVHVDLHRTGLIIPRLLSRGPDYNLAGGAARFQRFRSFVI